MFYCVSSKRLRKLVERIDNGVAPADLPSYAGSRKLVEEFLGKLLTDEDWHEVAEALQNLVEITPLSPGPDDYSSIEEYDQSQPPPRF